MREGRVADGANQRRHVTRSTVEDEDEDGFVIAGYLDNKYNQVLELKLFPLC